MASCLLKTAEYQEHLKASGIPEIFYYPFAAKFAEENGRLPDLSETPFADSLTYLNEALDLKLLSKSTPANSNYVYEGRDEYTTSAEKIKSFFGTTSPEEVSYILNRKFDDYVNFVTPLCGNEVFKITRYRNSLMFAHSDIPMQYDTDILTDLKAGNRMVSTSFRHASRNFILNVEKLAKALGISLEVIDSSIINNTSKFSAIPNVGLAKAFIQDGTIYINADNAGLDSAVHELLHVWLGNMALSKDSEVYLSILEKVGKSPEIDKVIQSRGLLNRTRLDALEEIFVTDFAKYVTGQLDEQNMAWHLSYKECSLLLAAICEMLNKTYSIFGAKYAVDPNSTNWFSLSLGVLAQQVGASQNIFGPFMPDTSVYAKQVNENAKTHRQLANQKENLIKEKYLIENCT